MRRETEAQIDILSEIVDDNKEATAYITGMEWMITTKWIRSILWGGATTIDRTNILRGGMGESNERIRSILRGMGRSHSNDRTN